MTAVDDALCHCKAHDDEDWRSHHTVADHRHDCPGAGPNICGGCWGCVAAQVYYWERQRGPGSES
jgi:hypothetical protein